MNRGRHLAKDISLGFRGGMCLPRLYIPRVGFFVHYGVNVGVCPGIQDRFFSCLVCQPVVLWDLGCFALFTCRAFCGGSSFFHVFRTIASEALTVLANGFLVKYSCVYRSASRFLVSSSRLRHPSGYGKSILFKIISRIITTKGEMSIPRFRDIGPSALRMGFKTGSTMRFVNQ